MKKALLFILLIIAVTLAAIVFSDYNHENDTIYIGGDILTMNNAQQVAEAIYIKNGKIVAIGSKDSILQLKTGKTQVVDLQGKTMMPGFFDAHGHYDLVAVFYAMTDVSGVNYRQPEEVLSRIETAVKKAEKDKWVYCYGFDPILTVKKIVNSKLNC